MSEVFEIVVLVVAVSFVKSFGVGIYQVIIVSIGFQLFGEVPRSQVRSEDTVATLFVSVLLHLRVDVVVDFCGDVRFESKGYENCDREPPSDVEEVRQATDACNKA